jgi:hypothetical protein
MNKAAPANRHDDGPSVISFKARLFRQPKRAMTGSSTLLMIPKWVSRKLPSRGMTKVEGTMNGHPFRAALEPNASGRHWLRVNEAMRKGAGADAGEIVKLSILGPEPDPTVPAEFQGALSASREARTLWKGLTSVGRRDWIRWINAAKKPETRSRRIARAVERLSSGKRHPCCVNIYEFMLCRIQKDCFG